MLLPQILEMTTSSTVLHTLCHIQRSRKIPQDCIGGIISAVVDVVISRELTDLEICLTGDTFSDDLKGRMLSHAMATTTRQHEYMEILANILN